MQAKHKSGNHPAVRHTYKSVEILTNPQTKKGGGSGNKKALSYGKQGRQTANENVAGTQSKGPCNKADKCKPPHMAAAKHR